MMAGAVDELWNGAVGVPHVNELRTGPVGVTHVDVSPDIDDLIDLELSKENFVTYWT